MSDETSKSDALRMPNQGRNVDVPGHPNWGPCEASSFDSSALDKDLAETGFDATSSNPPFEQFPDLLTVKEAAAYLRVSKNYLDKLRVSGGGPFFVRLGRRKVVYRLADLRKWIDQRLHKSTSEYAE